MSVLILFPPFLCPTSLPLCSSASDIVLIIKYVQPGKQQVGYRVRGIAGRHMHFQSSLTAKWTNVTRNWQLSEYKDTHEPSAIRFIILVLFPVLEILTGTVIRILHEIIH